MEYLSIAQVATKLGINPETVRRWLQKGQLSGFKVGKQWRIRRHDLSEFIKSNTKTEETK